MGLVCPAPGFLEGLRAACDRVGALLVFDEVITGFRVGRGGATGRFGVHAGPVVLREGVGGGLPLAAFGGRRDLMAQLAPLGPVYQAGTLSGNPLATAAGLAVLGELTERRLRGALPADVPPRRRPRRGDRRRRAPGAGAVRRALLSASSSPDAPVLDYEGAAVPRGSGSVRPVVRRHAAHGASRSRRALTRSPSRRWPTPTPRSTERSRPPPRPPSEVGKELSSLLVGEDQTAPGATRRGLVGGLGGPDLVGAQ